MLEGSVLLLLAVLGLVLFCGLALLGLALKVVFWVVLLPLRLVAGALGLVFGAVGAVLGGLGAAIGIAVQGVVLLSLGFVAVVLLALPLLPLLIVGLLLWAALRAGRTRRPVSAG